MTFGSALPFALGGMKPPAALWPSAWAPLSLPTPWAPPWPSPVYIQIPDIARTARATAFSVHEQTPIVNCAAALVVLLLCCFFDTPTSNVFALPLQNLLCTVTVTACNASWILAVEGQGRCRCRRRRCCLGYIRRWPRSRRRLRRLCIQSPRQGFGALEELLRFNAAGHILYVQLC